MIFSFKLSLQFSKATLNYNRITLRLLRLTTVVLNFYVERLVFGSCDSQTLTGTRFNLAIRGQSELIFWAIVSVVIDEVSDYTSTSLMFLSTLVSLNCMSLVACGFDSLLSQT